MSLDENLLNMMSETTVTHEHEVTDPDSYFIIDPVSRTMTNESRVKNVIMQFDHESEVYTFQIPRYVEGHDMMTCNRVRVHFNNIDGETGEEIADVAEMYDLMVNPEDPDTVISTWTIKRQATQKAGILSFLIQYECVNDGEPVYEWHTDIYEDVTVKKSKRNSEVAIIEYTHILEQWYQRVFGAGEGIIDQIEDAGAAQISDIEAGVQTAINNYIDENGIQIPSDDHINSLIDSAIGGIVNGEY